MNHQASPLREGSSPPSLSTLSGGGIPERPDCLVPGRFGLPSDCARHGVIQSGPATALRPLTHDRSAFITTRQLAEYAALHGSRGLLG